MPYNGSGSFIRGYSWTNDAANSIPITATRMDADANDIATALSDCITRDGQSPATANIPMGGFKLTGLAAATIAGDAVRYEQITPLAPIASPTFTGTVTAPVFSGASITQARTDSSTNIATTAMVRDAVANLLINTTYYTSSGAYTKATNSPTYITVEVWGGGGGGGGCSGVGMNAGGGGAGGYSFRKITAASLAASETVTIGAAGTAGTSAGAAGGTGGTTSFGAWASSTGGVGGEGSITTGASAGGAGGSGSGGNLNLTGSAGTAAMGVTSQVSAYAIGGQGAATTLGGNAVAPRGASNPGLAAASNSGSGGSGGCGSTVAGGAGGSGFVIVREYL